MNMFKFNKKFCLFFIALTLFQFKSVSFQKPRQQKDSVPSGKNASQSSYNESLRSQVKSYKLDKEDVSAKINLKTQQGVEPVIDKHPWAIYFALIAAGLAAIASIASSTITGLVTWKSKDKEYRNDFYKKVIDKRIKAIESAEQMISLFSSVSSVTGTNKFYHSFFDEPEKKEKWEAKVDDVASLNIWYSKSTSKALMNLTQSVSEILEEIGVNTIESLDFLNTCTAKYSVIEDKKSIVENNINNDMSKLYDIDAFFKAKLENRRR